MFVKAIILVGSKFSQICATFYFNNLFFNLFVCKQPSTAFSFFKIVVNWPRSLSWNKIDFE
jgi:hypothetical protein